jgi:hypothetical protein
MSYKLSEREFKAVCELNESQRYDHFIKRISDWRELWGLSSSTGWDFFRDDHGNQLFPVWPHARYAQAYTTGEWANDVPKAISLKDWLQGWTEKLASNRMLVTVFPVDSHGVVVSPERLKNDIVAYVDEWYDGDIE